MAETTSTVPAPAGSPLHDDLLATKVTIPRVRSDLVDRPGLAERIDEAATHDLCLVCSPPGFGKTTALAVWAATSGRPVAWLSLDDGDNDPVRFWRYLIAAIRRIAPDVGGRALTLLGEWRQQPGHAVATALINDLAERHEPIVAVVDDLHAIESQEVLDGLAFLLAHLPSGLQLMLASRSDPPLPLADLRAGGRLAELRAADLRFTPAEVAAFLGDLWDLALPAEAVAVLGERTEGWVAGLQLAALSLRDQSDPAAFVTAFAGSHRFVLDYLSEEVLARQSEEMRDFLLTTSVLERLSGPLCDALTGRSDGQQMLEAAERANLFVVPLDDRRDWYRYHHLFADLLRARLCQECSTRVADLHRRAVDWYTANGLASDAVHHALAAGDADRAARLIEAIAEELIWWRSEGATFERWVAALPRGTLCDRPRLALARALRALVAVRLEEAAVHVSMAERAPASSLVEPFVPTVGREQSELVNVAATIAFIRAVLASRQGDVAGADLHARQAIGHLTADDRLLGVVARALPVEAVWLGGQVSEAERLAEATIAESRIADQVYPATRLLYDLGQIQQAGGRLRAAEQTFRRALATIVPPGSTPMPAASLQHLGLAEVLRQRGDLDAALRHATEGLGLCHQLASAEPISAGFATLAWVQYAKGNHAAARSAVEDAARAVPSTEVVSLFDPGPAERARLLLALGEVEEVAAWVAERGLSDKDVPEYSGEREYLVLARLLLARATPDRALSLLERLRSAATSGGRRGSSIEINALRALALDAASEWRCALDALAEALALAEPEGYVRVFADEGASMSGLLRRLVLSGQRGQVPTLGGDLLEYAVRLLNATSAEQPDSPSLPVRIAGAMVLVEPLTERETEVLLLLAEGQSNREIADRLVVTLDTVKKHLTHIFGKLGAVSRTQAVARARELGLLNDGVYQPRR